MPLAGLANNFTAMFLFKKVKTSSTFIAELVPFLLDLLSKIFL